MLPNQSDRGLFVGLVTLDLIYLTDFAPSNNQKVVASDYTVAAGGPATNAAVTFSHLGNQATVLGVVGNHAIAQLIRADLAEYEIAIADLNSSQSQPPPVSSTIITRATGERAVVSINAVNNQVEANCIPDGVLAGVKIVLIDGHQMAIGKAIAQLAKANNIPVVIDGGSWKPGFETVLPYADYAICSANFHPPNCNSTAEVFVYLAAQGILQIAITQGEQPIQYLSSGKTGTVEVPQIQPVDTLGAGDVFHGAFCHYILHTDFTTALSSAAVIAADACQFFGTRRWMCD